MRRGTSGINALIAVNKPCGMSSHDVVNRVRRACSERRVGHAGTLDPDASGVLVVGIGQGTRLMGLLTAEKKSYVARITFGSQTTTDDAEGEILKTAPVPSWILDKEKAQAYLHSLVGEHMQVPPAYSAISVDGVRSYARARAGLDVQLEPRPITIYSALLIDIDTSAEAPSWICALEVSKGCYIRSIARDIGQSCDSAAHISQLMRASSGSISLEHCVELQDLEAPDFSVSRHALDPVVALGVPRRTLSADELSAASCGKKLNLLPNQSSSEEPSLAALVQGDQVALVYRDKLYGVWKREGSKLVCSVNFPVGIEGVRS